MSQFLYRWRERHARYITIKTEAEQYKFTIHLQNINPLKNPQTSQFLHLKRLNSSTLLFGFCSWFARESSSLLWKKVPFLEETTNKRKTGRLEYNLIVKSY